MSADFIDLKDLAFYIMFAVLYFLIPWIIVTATYSSKSRIDLSQLWMYKGAPDKFAVIIMTAFWVHTASMMLWAFARSVTTADYLAYAGVWVAPILVKMVGAAFGNGHKATDTPP